jgi:hypothetical protein
VVVDHVVLAGFLEDPGDVERLVNLDVVAGVLLVAVRRDLPQARMRESPVA